MFQAVAIEGAAYWDGGYMGNPPLLPLFDRCESDDVVIVQINPIMRPGRPHTARDILDRLNEKTRGRASRSAKTARPCVSAELHLEAGPKV